MSTNWIDPVHFWDRDLLITEDDKDAGYTTKGWYFWIETWAHVCGPYIDEATARETLNHYCEEYLRI